MNLPVDPDKDAGFDSSQSNSSNTSPGEIERIGQWIDHQEWDVLDRDAELRRDTQICMHLLQLGSQAAIQSFGTANDITVSPSNEAEKTQESDRITEPTVVELDRDRAEFSSVTELSDVQASSRFSNPELVGAGGFGIVFRVIDERLGIPVAIKIMRPLKSRSHELRTRFFGEAQTTAALSHPGIVRIYDTGQIGSFPYITSAYVAGGSLATWLSKHRTSLSPRSAAMLFSQLADAVHYAHSKATLHRDLKPGNILLELLDEPHGDQAGIRLLLTDFGLAKRLDRECGVENLTREGGLLGTTRYMSPEQARGAASEVGTTSDIFSLGIILYEMLVGRVPFDGNSDETVRKQIINEDPKRPRSHVATIPRDLEAILLKCLEKTPSNRYQTAHELWLDLKRFVDGRPIEARPPSLVRSAVFAVRSHPIIASVIGGLLLINFAAVFYSVRSSYREKEAVQSSMSLIGTLFSNFGDKVFAGSRITPQGMLDTLEPAVKFAASQVESNPGDDRFIHKLSVLKHYASVGHSIIGKLDEAIEEREEVIQLLNQLIAKQPKHPKFRFQLYNAHRTLGELRSRQANEIDTSKNPGFKNIERALEEINALVDEYPSNVDYLDAQNATKRGIAGLISKENPSRAMRLLNDVAVSSEQLWRQFPDRPLLAKHAIGSMSFMTSVYMQMGEVQQAFDAAIKAVRLSDEAWGNLAEESWLVEETAPIFETAAGVMLLNGDHADTLEMLTRCYAQNSAIERGNGHSDEIRMRRFRLYAMQIKAEKAVGDVGSLEMAQQALTKLLHTVKGTPEYARYKTFAKQHWVTSPELDKLLEEN